MAIVEIKVPTMGESISEALVADWRVAVGDTCQEDDILVELETDKVTLEIRAPVYGSIKHIQASSGTTVKIGDNLAIIEVIKADEVKAKTSNTSESKAVTANRVQGISTNASAANVKAASKPTALPKQSSTNRVLPPGAARLAAQHKVDVSSIDGSGKRGQVTKSDIVRFLDQPQQVLTEQAKPSLANTSQSFDFIGEREKVVPMSRLRQRIAERLVEAQHTAAILTTFNEIDMSQAIAMRKRYKDLFQSEYGVNLGFTSIFIKSVIHALQFVPLLNAEIREQNIIYKNYYDISVAVGGPKGLVVPVIRNADILSFAEIELEISRLANKVKEGSIELKDLEGGTFTISNGGVYGSMLSTPILNPPQSGILGIHNILKRPVVINDTEIVIRPIMFVALSYDHRIIDGKEAVTFLVKVKESVENPERMLLGI